MLTDNEVSHVAKLARLELNETEKEKFKKELSAILDYVETLNKADTSNVEPLMQVTGLVNSVREDESRGIEYKPEFLIGQAPESKNNLVKVKAILKK